MAAYRRSNPNAQTTVYNYPSLDLEYCANYLELLFNIATELREKYITGKEKRKIILSERHEKPYARWTKTDGYIYILESEYKEIVAAIEHPDIPVDTAEINTDSGVESDMVRKMKRKPRHWLLSTSKTISHFKIKGYNGKNFTYDRRWNQKPTEKSIKRLYHRVFHNVLIPNALIAKASGKIVVYTDIIAAIDYVMNQGERMEAWKNLTGNSTNSEWYKKHILQSFEFYVHDKIRDSNKHLPKKNRWTLDKYLDDTNVRKYTSGNSLYKWSASPKIKKLIDEFMANREIGTWSYKQMTSQFHVSRATVAKFFKMLDERRREIGPDSEYVTFWV
jgi:hypothetical protein